jgi:hypothetical protein
MRWRAAASGWADENPAQKNDFQPLIVDRFYSGRSDIYVGR